MSRNLDYPEWMHPLTVPVIRKEKISLEDIENCYTEFIEHLIRNKAGYWDGKFVVTYLDEWGLTRREKEFITSLEQQSFYLPKPIPEENKQLTLTIFFEEVKRFWPLFTSSGSKTPGFRAMVSENKKIVFTQPTFESGTAIPVEAIPVLEVISKKNLFAKDDFHEGVVSASENSFVNFNITRSIQKDTKWRKYIKIVQVPSHEWFTMKFSRFYPVGLGAIVTSPFAMALTIFLPPVGDTIATTYALSGLIAGSVSMMGLIKLSSYVHYELTPEGVTLLEQLKAWDAFQKSTGEGSAYTVQ